MRFFKSSVLLLGALMPLQLGAANQATLPADAVASVNGHLISAKLFATLVENDKDALRADARFGNPEKKLERVRGAVLDELVDRTLIAAETEKRGVAPTQEEIDKAENGTLATFGTDESYHQFLKENGLTREEYRNSVIRAGLCRERLAAALGKEHAVSDAEVDTFYKAHLDDAAFNFPERVSVAHIHIDVRHDVLGARLQHQQPDLHGEELEKAIAAEAKHRRELAEDLRRQILKGADFAKLAQQYSDDPGTRAQGGVLPPFPRRAHPHEFEEAAFGLKKAGDVSDVVQDFYGLHIIKLIEHLSPHTVTLSEAAPEIRRRLEQQRQSEEFTAWLKKARANATIIKRNNIVSANA